MPGVYVAGHNGLVGSAICRRLAEEGRDLITADREELDLTDQRQVFEWFSRIKPDQVYLAAARVGGIHANDIYPAQFIYENLAIQNNVVHASKSSGVKKLLFLGSSCIYPKFAEQPMTEDSLLTGSLEPTNQWYAIAKIAGIKLCQAYRRQYGFNAICAMPTNLYGPGDNFDLASSHVLPALIRKFHEAKIGNVDTVTIWGTGTPRREFLHVDDLASACLFLMERYDGEDIVNVGWGRDISIGELADLIQRIVAFEGDISYDATKPDGTPRKLLDTTRMTELGWTPSVRLEDGIESTYRWYCNSGAID